ncbi:helix-turn-helix domain-containing protein [Pedobacter sp. MC2016-24]|uniref:helix-turn-helix domain-containing protein n=1 Tax=Pedobacter sp. MC2016-24 TaxID=2780090 RepID=UPI00187F00E0|nr:helix-turn-helix domain-containing protein [Pedobacter sp. MC2016-24]MBE9603185.1 helix-turn-helix domain-containing protein [Pedobacter sp. MC2016-24]
MPDSIVVQQVINQLNAFHPLSKNLACEFATKSFKVSLKKNEYLMRKGEYSPYLYFIVEGILAALFVSPKQTVTTFISVSGDFLCAIEGMYGLVPCDEDVRAEADSTLIAVKAQDLLRFFEDYPEMNILMRKILERYYKIAHHRSVFFRVGSIQDKYEYFLNAYPNHAEKIPVEVIASFLNVKINTLQKIRQQRVQQQKNRTAISQSDIEYYLVQTNIFLRKKLTLMELSGKLSITPHELSRLLNLYFNKNFNSFINSYRVNYVLDQLSVKNNLKQYSLEGLGSAAGFSSRSSFFNEFKKHVGVTPFNYLNSTKQPIHVSKEIDLPH